MPHARAIYETCDIWRVAQKKSISVGFTLTEGFVPWPVGHTMMRQMKVDKLGIDLLTHDPSSF